MLHTDAVEKTENPTAAASSVNRLPRVWLRSFHLSSEESLRGRNSMVPELLLFQRLLHPPHGREQQSHFRLSLVHCSPLEGTSARRRLRTRRAQMCSRGQSQIR